MLVGQTVQITDVDFSDPICPSDTVSFDIVLNNTSGGDLAFAGKNFRIEVNGELADGPNVVTTAAGLVLVNGANTIAYPTNFAGAAPIDFSSGNLYTVVVELDYDGDGTYEEIFTENDIQVYVPSVPTLTSDDADNIICEGDEITFSIEPLGATSYTFYLNGDEFQNGASNSITFTEVGGAAPGSLSNGDIITIAMTDANGCVIGVDDNAESITVSVLDLPEGTLSTDATSGYFCEGENVSFTATGGVSYEWYVDEAFTGDVGANLTTGLSDGQEVKVYIFNANGCFSEESITLSEASLTNLGTIVIADNSICYGDSPNEIKGTAADGGAVAIVVDDDDTPEYQWQSSPNGVDFENIDGATSADYQPGELTQTTWFRRNVILSPKQCLQEGDPLVINVEPQFDVALSSNDPENAFCLGGPIVISATAGADSYAYSVNGEAAWGATRILNLTADSATTKADLEVKNGDVIELTATLNGCDYTTTLIISIDDSELNPGWVSDAPSNVICKDQTVTFTASGGNSYEFYINAYGNVLGAEVVGNVFTTSRITDGDIVYVRAYNDSGCFEEYSETFNVLSVTDEGSISFSDAADENGICYGEAMAGQIDGTAATVSVGDDLGYYWEMSVDNGDSWTTIEGETGQNYAPAENFTTPTKIRRVTYSFDTVDDGTYCNAKTSNALTLIVFPNYQLELTTGVDGNLFCSGNSVTITATEGADNYSYNLAGAGIVDDDLVRSWTWTTGTGNDIEDGETFTVTADFGECSVTETIVINVDNFADDVIPTLISNATADAICANDQLIFTAGPDVDGYRYVFEIDGVVAQDGANHEFTTSAIDSDSTVQVTVYNGGGCSDSVSLDITVPQDTGAGNILISGTDTTLPICTTDEQPVITGDGTGATVVGSNGSGDTFGYYWEYSENGGADWVEIVGQTGSDLPAGTVDINTTTVFRRWVYSTVAGTELQCDPRSDEVTIEVDRRTPVIRSSDADNTICSGDEVTFTLAGVEAGDTIDWEINGVSQGVATVNFTTSALLNGQTVTAIITTDAPASCPIESNGIATTVLDLPVATIESNATGDTVCAGVDAGNVPFSDDVIFTANELAGATYQFIINGDPIVVADNTVNTLNTADLDNFAFSVLEDDMIQEVKVIVTSASGCTDEATLDITLNFANADTIQLDGGGTTENICFGTEPTAFVNVNALAAPDGTTDYDDADYANGATDTYRWEKRVGDGDWIPVDGATVRNLYQAPALIQTTSYRRITISELNGQFCEDASNVITITVAEELDGGTTQRQDPDDGWEAETQVLCIDTVPHLLRVDGGSGPDGVRYQWQFSEDDLSWTDITQANGFDIDATGANYQPEAVTAEDISSIYELTFGALDGNTYAIIIGDYTFTATVGEDASAEGGAANVTTIADIIEILAIRINASTPTDGDGNSLGTKITATENGVSVLTITQAPGSIVAPDWDVTDTVLGDEDNDITSTQTHDGNSFTRFYRRSVYSVFGDDVLPTCETFSAPIQISINTIEPGVIENDDQYICYNEVPNTFDSVYNASSISGGAISYQWQSWNGDPDAVYVNIDGATDENFVPEQAITQTTYFRRVATSTLGVDAIACSENSNEVIVYVIPEVDQGSPLGFNGKICRSLADPLQVNNTDTDWFDSLIAEDVEEDRGGDDLLQFRWEFSSTNDPADWTLVHDQFADANEADWDDSEVAIANVRAVANEQLRNVIDTDVEVELYFRLVTTRYFYDTDEDGDVDEDDEACVSYSDSINITIEADVIYEQIAGPVNSETVCLGDAITPISYRWAGSATDLRVLNVPAGIDVERTDEDGDGENETITFSGIPATNGFIRIQTLPEDGCVVRLDSHQITVLQESITPDYILVTDPGGILEDQVLLNRDGISYNTQYYLCAGADEAPADREDNDDAQDVDFDACFNSPFAEGLSEGLIWYIEPEDAGLIDGITGEVDWDEEFRGEAVIGVTSLGCSGESNALEITVTVNEFDAAATPPTEPIPFELNQSQGVLIGGVPELGESYSITLNGVEYLYDVQNGDDCVDIGDALVDLINNDLTSPVAGLFSAVAQGYAPGDLNGNGLADETGRRIIITADYEGYSAPPNPPGEPRGYGFNFEIETNATSAPENAGARAVMSIYDVEQSSLEICNELVGAEPRCETSADTPDTQYFASSSGYSSIVYAIEDIVPGVGSEASPGSIDSFTGVMDWNDDGFFGTFNVTAYAIGCDGVQTETNSHAVRIYGNLDAPEDIFYDLLTLPECPALEGDTTQFSSNEEVTWSIDNPLAGRINSVTGLLTWNAGFYGTVVVTARIYGCGGLTLSESITVPGPSEINRISAVNTENQQACMGDNIDTIEYKLSGAATGANVIGLPQGIDGTTEARRQISTVTIAGDVLADAADDYILTINGISYTVNVGDDAIVAVTGVAEKFEELITDAAIGIEAVDNGDGTLTLTSALGVEFTTSIDVDDQNVNQAENVSVALTQEGGIYYLISGAGNEDITIPTTYNYTITTTGGNCVQTTRSGNITLNPLATLTVDEDGQKDQEVCNNNQAIDPIRFTLTGANVPLLSWDTIPAGIDNEFETVEQITTITIAGDVLADQQISTITIGEESLSDNGDQYSITLNGVNYTASIGEQTDFVDLDGDGNLTDADDVIDEIDDAILVLVDKINNDRDGDGDHDVDDDALALADDNFNYTATEDVVANTIEIILNPAPDGGTTFTVAVASNDPLDNDAESIEFETIASDAYKVTINGVTYTVRIGQNLSGLGGAPNVDTIAEVVEAFVLLIEDADIDITATNNNDDSTFTLTSNPGIVFSTAVALEDLQVDQAATIEFETTQEGGRFFTLTGTPTIVGLTADTIYTYTIQSAASDYGCDDDTQVAEIQGTITVKAEPQITLSSGEDPLEVCFEESITNVVYEITGTANLATIASLVQTSIVTIDQDVLSDADDTYSVLIDENTFEVAIGEDGSGLGGANPVATIDEVLSLLALKINDAAINVIATDNGDGATITLVSNNNESFQLAVSASDPDDNDNENIEESATYSGLPAGIAQSYDAESQIEVVTIGGDLLTNDTVDKYTITINGVDYDVTIGEDATAEGGADDVDTLEEILNLFVIRITAADIGITPVADAVAGTLTLTSTPGLLYTIALSTTDGGDDVAESFEVANTQTGGKFLTLSGAPTEVVEEPTLFTYVITTSGPFCGEASYTGEITVNPIPVITNPSGNADYPTNVCNGTQIDDIIFDLTNVVDWNEDEVNAILPNGIQANRVGNQIIIEGTPNLAVDDIALEGNVYNFTIESTDNLYSCSTVASFEGSFTLVLSRDTISFDEASNGALNADGQSVTELCELDPIVPIVFNNTDGIINAFINTDNDDYTGLPDGLEGDFDVNTGIFTIQGAPTNDVAVSTEFTYLIQAESISCEPIAEFEGIINIHPNSTIEHDAGSGAVNQEICDSSALVDIDYNVSNEALNAVISWTDAEGNGVVQPANLEFSYENGVAKIHGTPALGNTETQIYNYLIETDANTNDCDEASVSGVITIYPEEQLIHDGAQGALNQQVCLGEDISEIVFDVVGDATFGEVLIPADLPNGVNVSFVPSDDNMGGELRINGTPTDQVAVTTTYSFVITTGGDVTSICDDVEETITLTVYPLSTLVYSGANTALLDQHICSGETIEDITFDFGGGANSAVAAGLPPGLEFNAEAESGVATISGTPEPVLAITEYIYTITSVNENDCEPEIERTGKITVYPPLAITDWLDRITVTNETCAYSNDGSISVQENAISGGKFSTTQIVDVTMDNALESNDLITITITADNGTIETFTYTVGDVDADGNYVAHGAGVRDMDKGEISQVLADLINEGEGIVRGSNFVLITPNFNATNGLIRFTALNEGVGFELNFTVDDGDDHFAVNEVTANETLTYEFYWRTSTDGSPNGELDDAISNNLNVTDLQAGTYILTIVSDGGCEIDSPEVTITQPDPIALETTSICPTEITVGVSGGTGPYTVTLWNQNYTSSVVKGNIGVSVNFDLTDGVQAGRTYNIQVVDANGCEFTNDDGIPVFLSADTPTQLSIDSDSFDIVQPTCSNNGSIEINNNAFSIVGGSGDPGDYSNLTFSWTGSNGNPENPNNPNIYNLGPGEYVLTVRDSACETLEAVEVVTLNDNTDIVISPEIPDDPVYCSDGFIDVDIEGGSGDGFSIEILNRFGVSVADIEDNGLIGGVFNFRVENLDGGDYTIIVTDETTNCEKYSYVTIEGSTGPLQMLDPLAENQANFNVTDVTCFGAANGKFSVEFTGGYPPYEYSINDANWSADNFSTRTVSVTSGLNSTTIVSSTIRILAIESLEAGDYSVRIRDRGGVNLCVDDLGNEILLNLGTVTIAEPAELELSEGEVIPIPCTGGIGSIEVNISGGALEQVNGSDNPDTVFQVNVFYPDGNRLNISHTSSEPSLLIENLNVVGDYVISVSDANDCGTSLTVNLPTSAPDNLSATASIEEATDCTANSFNDGNTGASIKITSFNRGDGDIAGYPLWQRQTAIDLNAVTIALNGFVTGVDLSTIGVVIDGNTFDATATVSATSAQDVAANLAAKINASPAYTATLNGTSIQVKATILDSAVTLSSSSSSTTASSTTATPSTLNISVSTITQISESAWIEVPGLAGQEVVQDLQAGYYRAIIRDGSGCGGTLVQNATQGGSIFKIDNPQGLQFSNIQFEEITCSNPASTLTFKLSNGTYELVPDPSAFELTLNSIELKSTVNGTVSFSTGTSTSTTASATAAATASTTTGSSTAATTVGNTYTPNLRTNLVTIESLPPDDYELVVQNIQTQCLTVLNFTIEEASSITYTGETSFEIGPCYDAYQDQFFDQTLIEGGEPYENINGEAYYSLKWVYYPEDTAANVITINSLSTNVNFAPYPGRYELTIRDRNGCEVLDENGNAVPIEFTFTKSFNELQVVGTGGVTGNELTTPVSCGANVQDGEINIDVVNSDPNEPLPPYEITWEKQATNEVIYEQRLLFEGVAAADSLEVYSIRLNDQVFTYTTADNNEPKATVVSELTRVIDQSTLYEAFIDSAGNEFEIIIRTLSLASLELEIVTKNTRLAMVNSSSGEAAWTRLNGTNGNPNYTGYLNLSGLAEGIYRYTISSIDVAQCANNAENQSIQGIIRVENESVLEIREGPIVDDYLCNGKPGTLFLDVFDGNTGPLNFKYNGSDVTHEQIGNGQYIINIDAPVESAILEIVNAIDCSIARQIKIGNGTPLFDFTSTNYQQAGTFLAREDVTFNDLSEGEYDTFEFVFGDGTQTELLERNTPQPVLHEYAISGTYYVNLRIYNDLGCMEELSKKIKIGKGYSILSPNVFTPNGDEVNDTFRPVFNGLKEIILRIYDAQGSLVYEEIGGIGNDPTKTGISLKGWEGPNNSLVTPYYIYTVTGITVDDEEVFRDGTFILLE